MLDYPRGISRVNDTLKRFKSVKKNTNDRLIGVKIHIYYLVFILPLFFIIFLTVLSETSEATSADFYFDNIEFKYHEESKSVDVSEINKVIEFQGSVLCNVTVDLDYPIFVYIYLDYDEYWVIDINPHLMKLFHPNISNYFRIQIDIPKDYTPGNYTFYVRSIYLAQIDRGDHVEIAEISYVVSTLQIEIIGDNNEENDTVNQHVNIPDDSNNDSNLLFPISVIITSIVTYLMIITLLIRKTYPNWNEKEKSNEINWGVGFNEKETSETNERK